MNRLTRLAVCLYPRAWRERYGVEFAALLDELRPDLRGSLDIVKGALLMRMTNWSWGTILAMSGLLGAVVAFGISCWMPKKYVSQAVLKVTPMFSIPEAASDSESNFRIYSMSKTILSRTVLTRIIGTFGLYQRERSKMPIEDVIELMRKDIYFFPIVAAANTRPRAPAFMVQFSYEDPQVAQRVTRDLVSRFIDENIRASSAVFPVTLELIDAASLPRNPVSPKQPLITTLGLALGLALGAVGAFVRHINRPALVSNGIVDKSSGGIPVFRGTEVPVQALLEYLETDKTVAQFLNDFPAVTRDAAVSALGLAKSLLVK